MTTRGAAGRTKTPRAFRPDASRKERSATGSTSLTPAQKLIIREQKKVRAQKLTQLFLGSLRVRGIPQPIGEHHFAREIGREWRFDFAWLDLSLAVEQEGLHGRHQYTGGFIEDMKKYRTAAALGWTVFRFTTREMSGGEAAEFIGAWLARRKK